jgi:hypothetical protein
MFFVFLLIAQKLLVAQNLFEIVYTGVGYDNARSIIQTVDSGYAIAGSSTSYGGGTMDAFILKVDKLGAVEWIKDYGGNNVDRINSIRTTLDNGFILAGFSNSFGLGGYSVYLIRTDSNGDTLWTKTIGGLDWSFGNYAEQTNDTGFIVAGSTYNTSGMNEDIWLIKLDSIGGIMWEKKYGGINQEFSIKAIECDNGDYAIVGATNSFGFGNKDVFLIRTNSIGDTLWTKAIGESLDDEGRSVIETFDNGLLVCASHARPDSIKDFFLVKYDSTGIEEWRNTYFGNAADDEPYEIQEMFNHNLACIGYSKSFGQGKKDFVFLEVDSAGNFKYSQTYGGIEDDIGYSVSTTFNNGLAIAGETESYGVLPVNIYLIIADSIGISTGNVLYNVKETFQARQISVFPNPSQDWIYIISPPDVDVMSYIIFDINCRIIRTENFSSNPFKIPVQSFSDGIYFLTLNTSKGTMRKKFTVIHK